VLAPPGKVVGGRERSEALADAARVARRRAEVLFVQPQVAAKKCVDVPHALGRAEERRGRVFKRRVGGRQDDVFYRVVAGEGAERADRGA
jgi:hypothetical protein